MKDLNDLYKSFEIGIRSTKATKPQEYLKSIGLDYTDLRIGFNSGQFHHREKQEVKDHYQSLGLLTPSDAAVRTDEMTAYTVFGRYGLVFPLMNRENVVVNYFALRFELATPTEHYLNRLGLYPSYPNQNTKRLFIVPTVMDAASLLQSKALDHREAVLALYDGKLLPQHEKAIAALSDLEEIIIIKR
ncbi:hypothetical protein [Flavobacterium lindanitolerans]|uniref:hypothetical protein n=1 Tax=Flavobacterium lindanitolerans TaxID=428988 RepID=UPI0023F1813B|nr:hypothetical protein [Flavobacterium lindanitolerans]